MHENDVHIGRLSLILFLKKLILIIKNDLNMLQQCQLFQGYILFSKSIKII